MICGNHEVLERFVAGQTSPAEAEEIRRHLADCHACAQVVETLRQPSLENFTPFAPAAYDDREPPAGLECPSPDELRAHLDGTLSLDRRAEVHDHLAECDHCFERVRLLRQGLTVDEETVETVYTPSYASPELDEEELTAAPHVERPADEVLTPPGISGFRQFLSHAAVAAAAVAVAVTANASGHPPFTPTPPRPTPGAFSPAAPPPGGPGIRPGGPGAAGSAAPEAAPGPGSTSPGLSPPGDRPGGMTRPGGPGAMFGSPTRPGLPGTGLNSPTNSPSGNGGTSFSTPTPRPTLPGTSPGTSLPNPPGQPRQTPAPPPGPPPAVVMESVLPIRRPAGGAAAPGQPRTPEPAQKAIQEAAEAARTGGATAGIRTLQEFVQRNPEAPAEVQAFLGTLYLKAGDRDRAGQAFAEAAKRLQPPAAPPAVEPAPATPPAAAPGNP